MANPSSAACTTYNDLTLTTSHSTRQYVVSVSSSTPVLSFVCCNYPQIIAFVGEDGPISILALAYIDSEQRPFPVQSPSGSRLQDRTAPKLWRLSTPTRCRRWVSGRPGCSRSTASGSYRVAVIWVFRVTSIGSPPGCGISLTGSSEATSGCSRDRTILPGSSTSPTVTSTKNSTVWAGPV